MVRTFASPSKSSKGGSKGSSARPGASVPTAKPQGSSSNSPATGGGAGGSGAAAGKGSTSSGGGGKAAASSAAASKTNASTESVVALNDVSKVLPGNRVLLQHVGLSFYRGAKVGVLGLNGAGKSTLLKIIAGVEKDFDGQRWIKPNMRVGFLSQEPQLDPSKTVRENVMDGLREKLDLLKEFNDISEKMADPEADFDTLLARQSEVQATIERLDCWNLEHKIQSAIRALRCPPGESSIEGLSGGERRRVALCRLLLEEPDILLLDEPTNHLDAESVGWLERFLRDYKGTVIAVTHDRYFLDNVAGWILEIDRGMCYPYEGNYSRWLELRAARAESEEKQSTATSKAMKQELEWIRQGPKGRQSKSKARIAAYHDKVAKLQFEKESRQFLSGQIVIPRGPRLGDVVVNVEGVSYDLGDRQLLKNVNIKFPAGAIVGVVGPNGVGKTTLMRIITGEIAPTAGSVSHGSTVRLGYVWQSRSGLSDSTTVADAIAEGDTHVGNEKIPVRQYIAGFNLIGSVQQKAVHTLSGGERNRVHLARCLKRAPNVLLLDEPTNDLDVETLRSLEESLRDFLGTAIVVSHDRYFLDRICTHTLAFEADGALKFFEGNYAEYEAYKRSGAGEEAP